MGGWVGGGVRKEEWKRYLVIGSCVYRWESQESVERR